MTTQHRPETYENNKNDWVSSEQDEQKKLKKNGFSIKM